MNKHGVIILCVKKPSYAMAAYNLALSIQYHSPGTHITLLSDGIHSKVFQGHHFFAFNIIKEIPKSSIAKAKLSIADFAFADNNLYIDADSVCLQDINPIFEKLKGESFKSNVIDNYTNWTTPETFEEIFGVKTGQTINSSWIYFENKKVFKKAQQYLKNEFPVDRLIERWGGQLPDEMFFNAALSNLKVDAKIDFDLMYFDSKASTTMPVEIKDKFYFMTFHGNQHTSRLLLREYYDRLMSKICGHFKTQHRFKMHEIISNKLVNEK